MCVYPLKMRAEDITVDISTPQRESTEREQQPPISSERKGAHIPVCLKQEIALNFSSFFFLRINLPWATCFTFPHIHVILSDLTETLEMRENLQKQLQEIMSATKLSSGRRASSRLARVGSGGQDSPHTPEILGRIGRRSRTLEALR